jgi:hypothetical protein
VQQRDALLDHPAVNAEAGAVLDALACEVWGDLAVVEEQAVRLGVVGPVGVERQWSPAGSSAAAADGG